MLGKQTPRISSVPAYASSSLGDEAVELAESVGLTLDPWQQLVLRHSLGTRDDGKWAAFEVGVNVPRQNGKGSLLEARELAGLFLLGEPMITHSAHQFDTSLEAFRRLRWLIEESSDLAPKVKRFSQSHGEEGIELLDGSRIRFRTRTKGGGRGFTADCLILDEAMMLPEATISALLPTLSARSQTGNPQVWYTGSAVDQTVHEQGVVFARVRERGHRGDDPDLAYFEWSVAGDDPDQVDDDVLSDPKKWAEANPGLGIRISLEHIERERKSPMGRRAFAVERDGIGDWPATEPGEASVIDLETWDALIDLESEPQEPLCYAFDVSPNRGSAAIAVAGLRLDGLAHVEVGEHKPGVSWVVSRLVELAAKHPDATFICDGRSPAAALLTQLEEADIVVETVTAPEHARACGILFDKVESQALRHLGTAELRAAVKGARTRVLAEAWAWARTKSTVDITPLVAVTLALWGTMQERPSVYENRPLLTV